MTVRCCGCGRFRRGYLVRVLWSSVSRVGWHAQTDCPLCGLCDATTPREDS